MFSLLSMVNLLFSENPIQGMKTVVLSYLLKRGYTLHTFKLVQWFGCCKAGL